ncbi:uncharacterized protein N7459_004408 [Penicillium hispanicum]|uniref:uncharacterized protein n=1 Tax=Penicillium hispanicum TaxID=1080232 RepID=UPI00254165E1|nr:uncharacterized protein N7459_004408 [Penicillium hispanicum]KAJ5584608.1 hypothetical protein N7459_004408 [Penicillium hispanicum]
MAPFPQRNEQSTLPCPSWVFSNNSDVHVAKDRSWFGDDYTPFASSFHDISGNMIEVVGVGSVTLPTKTSPRQTGPSSHGILRLKQVLHAPGALCNLIGGPITDDHGVVTFVSDGSSGFITKGPEGHPVAYFKPQGGNVVLLEVSLSEPPIGPRVGPSPFHPSGLYMIHAFWPETERRKFAARPLTPAEKAWRKRHFGSEFKFLQMYDLSIYNEDDREQGRRISRALMSDGDSE